MKNIRWYDKNSKLKQVIEIVEGLSPEYQDIVAKDIIQILAQDFNLNFDDHINDVGNKYNYNCKRNHDNNIDLFTSFEIIKGLEDGLQHRVAESILETILLLYLVKGANG